VQDAFLDFHQIFDFLGPFPPADIRAVPMVPSPEQGHPPKPGSWGSCRSWVASPTAVAMLEMPKRLAFSSTKARRRGSHRRRGSALILHELGQVRVLPPGALHRLVDGLAWLHLQGMGGQGAALILNVEPSPGPARDPPQLSGRAPL